MESLVEWLDREIDMAQNEDMTNAMLPAAGETVTVEIPALRTLKVARFTSEETGEFYAPVSVETVRTVAVEQTEQSSAKTVRPARRGRA